MPSDAPPLSDSPISSNCSDYQPLESQRAHPLNNIRMQLLACIEQDASILQAAQATHLNYGTALAELDAINNLASKPMLIYSLDNQPHNRGYLTDYGRRALRLYTVLKRAQQEFQQRIADEFPDFDQLSDVLQALHLKSSARNQLRGRVRHITDGQLNAQVVLDIGDNLEICATLTANELQQLGLHTGCIATAIIKPSFVLLSIDSDLRTSARNRLGGIISDISLGTVNCEVRLTLPGGHSLLANITREALAELDVGPGSECWAIIKAAHVLLAIQDRCAINCSHA